ncbi:MAG TPA: hypothetical protein VF244_00945 [Acidimicrobiales bacterium]
MKPQEVAARWTFAELWNSEVIMDQSVLLDFFKALIVCCNADNNLTPAERAWCVGYAAAIGATEDTLAELHAYAGQDDISVFFDRGLQWATAPRTVIYESIRACASDADYNQLEKDKIARMATLLDIGADEVATLEQLYYDEKALRTRKLVVAFPAIVGF